MASSSSALETNIQTTAQQAEGKQERASYELKGVTMSLKEWQLKIQTENPVDFASLAYHGCDIKSYYETQGLMNYFNMLNGPTYKTLIRYFWVRASVYDKEASEEEERDKVLIDPTLAGKTREEMELEPFKQTEIRSSIMGIPVYISEDIIARVIGAEATGKFSSIEIPNSKTSSWNDVVNKTLFNSTTPGKYSDLSMKNKMLLKIQYENLLPKGAGSDQPSLAHKVILHHIINGEKVNVPKYIFKHMIKELRESQKKCRVWIPYGRLISEIFHQGGILQALIEVNYFTDEKLETETGKVINASTLKNMRLIPKVTKLKTDLNESRVVSNLMEDFPPICKKDTLDVKMALIADYYETHGKLISLDEVPEEMYGGELPVTPRFPDLKISQNK